MRRLTLILILLVLSVTARAELIPEAYEGVRPTGMGNAFIALADDANAPWYNPAALTKIKGTHFNLFDFTLGADGLTTLGNFKSAVFNGNYNNLITLNQPADIRFAFHPTFITKYFAFSLYSNSRGYFNIQDTDILNAYADVYAFSDLGLQMAAALPITDYFSAGVTVRGFERSGVSADLTTQDLLAELGGLSASAFESAAYNELKQLSGTGLGLAADLGTLLSIPLSKNGPLLQAAVVVQDVGNTTFRSIGSSNVPQSIQMSYNAGTALIYNVGRDSHFNFTFDLRHNFESIPFVKRTHLGMEYRYKNFSLRAGASEGYPSYGASLEVLPHTKIHFSSYADELGDTWNQTEQRYYLLQISIGFNPL